ncbi:MAG TPA: response regulator [Acetobacteraceae bacterium]|nr:response regulator [Acetobacteraceae bacterium]
MNVLLVEDDDSVRSSLADLLVDAGLRVTPVASACEALGIAENTQPAVLLADVRLGPGMNGLALVAEARRRWPGIRCVLMTGDPVAAQTCEAGADLFLTKPFRTAALLAALGGEMAG